MTRMEVPGGWNGQNYRSTTSTRICSTSWWLAWFELHDLAEMLGVALEPPRNTSKILDINIVNGNSIKCKYYHQWQLLLATT